jgi:hypothetical protein
LQLHLSKEETNMYEVTTRSITVTACKGTLPDGTVFEGEKRYWDEGSLVDLHPLDASSLAKVGAVKELVLPSVVPAPAPEAPVRTRGQAKTSL